MIVGQIDSELQPIELAATAFSSSYGWYPMDFERGDQAPSTGAPPVGARRETREAIGRRVSRFRAERGWTQQDLADRLAMSRTAVSHLEADMAQPSERTVLLLAGLFHVEPPAFVDGTLYPMSKAERLPTVVARYTEADLQIRVLEAELALLASLQQPVNDEFAQSRRNRLIPLLDSNYDHHDCARINEALKSLRR